MNSPKQSNEVEKVDHCSMVPDRELQLLNIPEYYVSADEVNMDSQFLTRRSHHDRKPRTLVIRG